MSACLLGVPCRYDGASKRSDDVLWLVRRALACGGCARAVCPELAGGLPCPRAASEMLPDGRVMSSDGRNVTLAFRRGAQVTLRAAKDFGADLAVLKDRSPSCGTTCIYDGSFTGTTVPGQGVAARLLARNGVPLANERDVACWRESLTESLQKPC